MATRQQFAIAVAVLGTSLIVNSVTAPQAKADEQAFFSQMSAYYHPNIPQTRLLELGYQACSVRRAGQDSDAAKAALNRSLDAQGIFASNAEIGTLVHVAVDTLCPEVGYP